MELSFSWGVHCRVVMRRDRERREGEGAGPSFPVAVSFCAAEHPSDVTDDEGGRGEERGRMADA